MGTVEEWVAALPEEGAGGEEDEKQERQEKGEEDEEDTLSLGAEAVLQGLVENSRGEQEEQLRPSRTSATSLISSCCSRESLLQSREPDPEQVLLGLGFGGTDSVTSIPKRFLIAPSKARGVCIETFKKQERVEHSRAEGGYLGYLGLTGPNRRPTVIVDRILQSFVEAEGKDLQRTSNQIHLSAEVQGCQGGKANLSSIPTRFQRKDPKRPRFDPSLVSKALEGKPKARSLRQVASTLLQKDLKGKREKRLFSVEEEEGSRLAEGDLAQTAREAEPQIEKSDEEDLKLISVEMDAAGEEVERKIETMEKEEAADILRVEDKDEEKMTKQPKVDDPVTQSEASILRSLLRLALTELDGEGRQTLRKHLDDGMEASELYQMALSLPRKVKGGERKCAS